MTRFALKPEIELRTGLLGALLSSQEGHCLQAWPHLQVQITEAVEDVLETAVTNSVIDVAIGGPIPESEDIVQVAEHGFTDRYSVLSAVSHPLQGRGELSIHDVAAEPWVMPPPVVRFLEALRSVQV
jgi:DNA-binding transcriptional LysR family regulator